MIIKKQIPIYQISWLNYADGGKVAKYYEPESKDELVELCRSLYAEGKAFDVIGHTSNIYFLPSYNVDVMVSTRKVRNLQEETDCIIADCGVSVKTLARKMVDSGIKGFEGLIDLPGTVAASVYGNASCYGCSINELLLSFDVLRSDGTIVTLTKEDLKLAKRSSSFKRGEQQGVILSAKLRKEIGNRDEILEKAERNHLKRESTQPSAQNNLGSVYSSSSRMTVLGYLVKALVKVYALFERVKGREKKDIAYNRKLFMLSLIGAKDLMPYMYSWNRFVWKDAKAHELFWKFHEKHQLMFKKSDFEIIIKGNQEY